jgi:hypothetical protein
VSFDSCDEGEIRFLLFKGLNKFENTFLPA